MESQAFSLAQVEKELSPYIKSRQEAQRIRRILSIYVTSQIEGLGGDVQFIGLLPNRQVRVRGIPPDLSGTRREYLKALQKHSKATTENANVQATLDKVESRNARKEQRQDDDFNEALAVYLSLIRERRKHDALRIIQNNLEILASKDAAKVGFLSRKSILESLNPAPEIFLNEALGGNSREHFSGNDGIQKLQLQLQKAVLKAKNAAENETRLLQKVKDDQRDRTEDAISEPLARNAKIFALSQTRDELIKWIEQQLPTSGHSRVDSLESIEREYQDHSPDLLQRKKAIESAYSDYVQARQTLVDLISRITRQPDQDKTQIKKADLQNRERLPSNDSGVKAFVALPYVTEHLQPAITARKDILQTESHVSSSLVVQDRELKQLLDHLADESHLLHNYPLLSTRQRDEKQKTAAGPQRVATTSKHTTLTEGESVAVLHARAWAFAADAAKSAKEGAVQEKLERGEQFINRSRDVLEQIQELTGVNGNMTDQNELVDDAHLDSSERVEGAKSAPNTALPAARMGIWAGLDGEVSNRDPKR